MTVYCCCGIAEVPCVLYITVAVGCGWCVVWLNVHAVNKTWTLIL